jgi:TRAP-type C4-dicarboxylate transport system substrate-binding protein
VAAEQDDALRRIAVRTVVRAVVAPLVLLASGWTAAAAEKTTLRLGDSLPVNHVIHEAVTRPFIEAVARRTRGKVEIQHFPAEQLGKARDLLNLTQAGVIDIGYVVPAYSSDRMPLSAVAELPGAFRNACQGSLAFWQLTREDGFLGQKEFKPNNVRPLITFALPTYQIILSTKKPVASVKDLEGLKIRSAGGAIDLMIRSLKAVPIRMSPPEIYEAMSRGTIDGALLGYQSVVSYDLFALLKSGTVNEPFASVLVTYSVSEAKWKAMPEELRQILAEEGERVTRESCAKFAKAEEDALAKARARGMTLIAFPAEDGKVLKEVFETVRQDWADGLQKRGKPGKQALEAWDAAIKALPPTN